MTHQEDNKCTNQFQDESPVGRMFEGRSIFITGASGFIGRVLLEKLLRSYTGIKSIYILMRPKKGQLPNDRLHKQLLKAPIFDKIRAEEKGSDLFDKLVVVSGDIGLPGLGIGERDLKMMLDDQSLAIVFHSAATIKFDEPLKVSVNLNLIATKTIIELCRKMPNLISLVHVSTAYANADIKNNTPIEEKLYDMRDKPEQLIQLADNMGEDLMQTFKFRLVDQRPNTYTYTKALAEHLIFEQAADLPVIIVRPSIVVASWREPVPGWIDNLNGPTGLILAIGKGLLRSMYVSRPVKADIIPVDIVVNTMVASAYYAAKINNNLNGESVSLNGRQLEQNEQALESTSNAVLDNASKRTNCLLKQVNDKPADISTSGAIVPPIIHCNSGHIKPITWGEMEDTFFPIIRKYPSCQVLRYPFGSFKSNKYHDLVTRMFVHFLPALIIDMLCALMGKKRQLLSIYHKLHSATAALAHFCTTNYNFQTKNITLLQTSLNEFDRRDLYMDIENIDWPEFWVDYVKGARRYVLKEEDHTLPEARKSFLRAYYIEIVLRVLLVVIVSACCMPIAIRLLSTSSARNTLQALNLQV